MTIDEQKVLKSWKTFVKNGLQLKHFTNRLYQHLTLHCNFIAHYNKHGFYDVYFNDGNTEATQRFLNQFDRELGCVSAETGMTYWINDGNDICELNNAMVDTLKPFLDKLRFALREKEKENVEDELEEVLAKYKRVMGE